MADATNTSGKLPATQEKRCRVGHLHQAFVVEKEIGPERAQWRGPEMTARWDANRASPAQAADAAISPGTAEECN